MIHGGDKAARALDMLLWQRGNFIFIRHEPKHQFF